jgi:hypothetical protein
MNQLLMKLLPSSLFSLFLMAISPPVFSEWSKLANPISQAKQQGEQLKEQFSEKFIDMDTVKQTGPMAIYRQVMILSQGARTPQSVMSSLSLYEYDCMNTKLRIINTTSFTEEWAKGEIVALPPAPNLREWGNLPRTVLGKQTFDMLCPSGK